MNETPTAPIHPRHAHTRRPGSLSLLGEAPPRRRRVILCLRILGRSGQHVLLELLEPRRRLLAFLVDSRPVEPAAYAFESDPGMPNVASRKDVSLSTEFNRSPGISPTALAKDSKSPSTM